MTRAVAISAAVGAVLVAAALAAAASGSAWMSVVPYVAFAVFLMGFCYRVAEWAAAPVPFRVPTTCGQEKSLPWIRSASFDNPSTSAGVVGRMAAEILLFRSLFRNGEAELCEGRLIISEQKLLWLAALAFHWSLLIILVRHLRLLLEPVPSALVALERMDGFFQLGAPPLYISDVVFACALAYLLWRRLGDPVIRYISQFSDYFALLLLVGIGASGLLMRYLTRVDVVSVKQFALGLATFHPVFPSGLSAVFAVHLGLISLLAVYFPFSKLMHMGGAFLSPTRNLANNNRALRHVNPWDYPVKTHTYVEWEEEFRDKLTAAEIPLDHPSNETEHVTTASAD